MTINPNQAPPGSVNRSRIDRPADDFYPTPPEATIPFLQEWKFCSDDLWECACGDGAISKLALEAGYNVVSTNLTDRGYGEIGVDFLTTTELRAPCIITNPPASLTDEFVKHALELGAEEIAFLIRSKFIEGGTRYRDIHARNPFQFMYQFVERITFFSGDTPIEDQPGWSNEAFAWFVWTKYRHEPTIRWLHRDNGEQPKFI